MREVSVTVVNRLGLHARAAAKLVRLASGYASKITVIEPIRNVTANAKSILSLLTLSASTGTVLIINVTGEDEEEAAISVTELFRSGFGE